MMQRRKQSITSIPNSASPKTLSLFLGSIAFLLQLFFLPSGFAQGPPVYTETPLITGFAVATRSFFHVVKKSGGGGELSVTMVPVMLPFSVMPNRLVLAAAIPYMEMDLQKKGATLSNAGWGDLKITATYNLFQADAPRLTRRATLLAGIKFPTAEEDRPGFPPPLQLGTGSTDYTAGVAVGQIGNRLGLYGDLQYTFKTEGQGYEFGDTLQVNLALGYRLLPKVYETYPARQLNLFLELNGLDAARDQTGGQTVSDSGGQTLFVSPGIQWVPLKTALFEASTQIPLFEDLNGDSLKTDYAYRIGFRWLVY